MTNEQQTEGTDTSGESEDSPVIRALRQQVKDLEKQVKSAPTRESLEAEIRAEQERKTAIGEQLVALGHPKGMSEVLYGKLAEEDEITRETVASHLKSIGYQVEVDGATSEDSQEEAMSEQHTDLANVTNLSAQVASAAKGTGPVDVSQAQSPEEIVEIMQKQGLLKSHI